MLAVGFHIGKVVEDVNAGRDQTEQCKTRERPQERIDMEQLFVEDERGENENILRPLARAHGF